MKKIGISAFDAVRDDSLFEGRKRVCLSKEYIDAIVENGDVPLVLPIVNDNNIILEQVKSIDALILSGGGDINPTLYRKDNLDSISIDDLRDAYELKLLECALKLNKPILGICRGLQMINVYFNGTLLQHIDNHNQNFTPDLGAHEIKVRGESWLEECLGKEIRVNSFHHQVIDMLGDDIIVDAISNDGYIEAISIPEKHVYAVQFHPEMMFKKDICFHKMFTIFYK